MINIEKAVLATFNQHSKSKVCRLYKLSRHTFEKCTGDNTDGLTRLHLVMRKQLLKDAIEATKHNLQLLTDQLTELNDE